MWPANEAEIKARVPVSLNYLVKLVPTYMRLCTYDQVYKSKYHLHTCSLSDVCVTTYVTIETGLVEVIVQYMIWGSHSSATLVV